MPQSSVLIGVAGGSGAGKTCLARELAVALDASILSLDHYYRDLTALDPAERAARNFDHPDSLEWPLLVEHATALAAGRGVEAPVYDFAAHTRLAETQAIAPGQAVIIEGILALHDAALRRVYRLSIYVDAPEEVRFHRRLARDVGERGRTAESVFEQFERTVRPMHEQFVEPTRLHAGVVADGQRSFAPVVDQILQAVRVKADA